jgi:ATP-dependent Clp protease ATP-binding subunit ClpB
MTSNIGSHLIQEMGQKSDYKNIKEAVMEQVSQHFRPEFINRIDDSVVFHALSKEEIVEIAVIQVDKLKQRLKQQDMQLDIQQKALDHLAAVGFDPVYGARPLKRVIQQQLENPLAQSILTGEFKPGDTIKVGMKGDELTFK